MQKEMQVAREAAKQAGEIITKYFRQGVEMRSKETYNLVSDADVEAEHAIADTIKAAFAEHGLLGEEVHQDDVNSEHLWVIDPLDGTTNFAHQIPHFAVSIAYYHHGVPQCGVVYNPLREDWYTAQRGQGAFLNGEPIRVDPSEQLNQMLVGVGFYYDRGKMMEATLAAIQDLFTHHIHGIRRFGTASLDLCQVASGKFGAFFEYALSPWDFAAGVLVVQEAGGRVSTCQGDPLPLAKSSILVSNNHVHQAMLDVVRPHWRQG